MKKNNRLNIDYRNKKISVIIRRWLFSVIVAAFIVSLVGIIAVQGFYQRRYSYALIETYVRDVSKEVDDSFQYLLDDWSESFTEELEKDFGHISNDYLAGIVEVNSEILSEINIIDGDGIIVFSSEPEYVGWDMSSGEQGAEFLCLLHGQEYYEQSLRLNDYSDEKNMIYCGRAFSSRPGFVEFGISEKNYDSYVDKSLAESVKNRRVGFTGLMIICEEDFNIIGSTDDRYNGKKFDDPAILPDEEGEIVRATYDLFGKKCYAVSTLRDDHYIIGGFPVNEAGFEGNLDKILIFLMNGIILLCILIVLSKTLDIHVINSIEDINGSLAKITGGDLEEKADVETSLEFIQLSDGINQTVNRLKDMIDEAETRIEEELDMAKNIQQTSLPNCVGFLKHNKYFELWAGMETAKMVGGDFYDFYMLPNDVLAVTMADVSDKGIPAAMFMMRAKTLLKSLAEDDMTVEEMAIAANKGLWENNEGSMFVTAWVGFIDLKTGTVRYVHAGHTCPVLFGNSEPVFIKQKRQMFIGGVPDVKYEGQEFVMKPGDALFLYTDGVTEAELEDGTQYGNERLLSVLSGMKEAFNESGDKEFCKFVCRKVVADVHSFIGDIPQSDDITVLCVKYR